MKLTCIEECYKYLSYSRTEYETRLHLKDKGYEAGEIEDAVAEALKLGYINDSDYCDSYVRDKLSINHWGPDKVYHKLREKGVESDLIKYALEDKSELIRNNLLRAAEKKAELLDISDYKDKNKLINHLVNKGYNYYMIKEVLHELE